MTRPCSVCGEPTVVRMRTHRRRTILGLPLSWRTSRWEWACLDHVQQVALRQVGGA